MTEHVDPSMPPDASRDPDAIYRDIHRTREDMDRTFDELQRRLSPRQIAHNTLDSLKEASTTMYRAALDTIKDHPIPAAIAGLSLAYLATTAFRDRSRHHRHDHFSSDRCTSDADFTPEISSSDKGKVKSALDSATRAVTETAHSAKQKVSGAAHSLVEHSKDAAHQLNESRRVVQQKVQRGYVASRDALEHSFHDHPLLIGAGVFSAGLALGAALPSTRKENEWLGECRDELLSKAKDRVTRAAQSATNAATDAAKRESLDDPMHLINDVRSQSGTGASAREVGQEVGRRAGSVVGEAIHAAKQEIRSATPSDR